MERNKDEYTYLEWVTGIRYAVNLYCDAEVNRISHDNTDEKPRELIKKLRSIIDHHESQIPDDIVD